ncbi:hypothetical protein ACROYT_G040404 [Oculina patagonica]
MNNSVALVAGLATGIPVVVLVSIYMVYCCCRRKQQDDRLQEPRLWRIKDVHSTHDPYIPPFVPRIVQKFVQHSHRGTHNSSSATSAQTSPIEEKSFFSEDSGSYRTAPDDAGLPDKRHSLGSFEALNVPTVRRSSLLQLSTSSGDSSESIYEQRKSSDVSKSPRNFPKSSSKSFEFVRPIPVKPLITITRVESKDDMSTKLHVGDVDPNGQSHSDSQVLPIRRPPKPSRSLDNVSVPSRSGKERKGSTDRNLGERRKASIGADGGEQSKQATLSKIPMNIPSQVIHPRKDTRRRSSQSGLGRLNVSLQYKQTTCDLFIKILQARELPTKDLRNNTSSPYVRVYALPTRRHNHRTTVIEKNLHPVWNELFIISGLTLSEIRQLALHFLIIHHQPVSRNVVIGEVMMALGGMDLTGGEVNVWRELRPHQFQNILGELHLSVCHQPLSSKLSVTVLEARNLPKISSLNIGDPYVKVELFSASHRVSKKKTRVKKKTVNPKFAQTFTFDLGGKLTLDHMTLMFTVLVQDSSGCHERIGQWLLCMGEGLSSNYMPDSFEGGLHQRTL